MQEDRYKRLLNAIDEERKAEELHYKKLSQGKSIAEKLDSGIVWFPVVIEKSVYTVGEQIELTVERTKHMDMPHKFKTGVGCRLFRFEGSTETESVRGIVSGIKKNKMSLILSEQVHSKSDLGAFKGYLGLELIYDDRPYKIMEEAIKRVSKTDTPAISNFKSIISKKSDKHLTSYREHTPYTIPTLNDSQNDALQGALSAPPITIIHGPPGTGKTTTLVQLTRALLKEEKKILVCAPSNNAVDLLAIKLDAIGISTLRVGNVTRISDRLSHLTLAEKARLHDDWQHIKKVKIEANNAIKMAGKRKRSFGPKERAQRNAMYREAKDLRHWAKDLEQKLLQSIIANSQAICSTLIGVSHKSISDLHFDTVIIDEASQALEPECWNVMLRADKVILAGDHLQLAPTVKSKEAIEMGLADTLLSRLSDKISHTYLLRTQYRMHASILSFSNHRFYDNQLESSDKVAQRSIDDRPLEIIDTSGCGFDETQNLKTLSRFNEGEYFMLREHFLQHQSNYKNLSIGIITPYAEQAKFITSRIEEETIYRDMSIRVNSIDGFQGQEKDVIYISLVRSNQNGEIGFLADERRLNVALTRARQKLIVIGDFSTLSQNSLFNSLAEHVEKVGHYSSGWEYMDMT